MFSIQTFVQLLSSPLFWVSLFIVLFLRLVFNMFILRQRMPPGPMPLPFVGNLLLFRGVKVSIHESCLQLSKKYGDPMTLFFGGKPAVVLSTFDVAKEVLQQPIFSSRPDSYIMDELVLNGTQDIALAKYGPLWQLHRKLATKGIRSIVDNEKLENQVIWAIDYTLEQMLKQKTNVDPKTCMRHAVYNVIVAFAFGKTYNIDDQEFLELIALADKSNEVFSELIVFDFLPFAKYLPLKKMSAGIRSTMEFVAQNIAYMQRNIDEHRETYQPGDIRDFCDAMIHEQELLVQEGEELSEQLNDKHLAWIIADFFNAGTDTTAGTLTWLILFMVLHPDIQDECYGVIKEVIGDRAPRLSDRPKLPLVEAIIKETLRLRPPASMSLPHAPTTDAKIGNYFVPRGAMTLTNIYAMHVDPAYWTNPLEFNPMLHFMDENGQIKKPPSYLPFGFGRRMCLGEQLAKNDLFLITARLLQKVRIEKIPGQQYSTDYNLKIDFKLVALPFAVAVSPRA